MHNDTIQIAIYYNDVGKVPRIHVWDGEEPNKPISFHVQIGILSLPDKIEVLKVQYGKLPDEIITTLSKWVYSNANPRILYPIRPFKLAIYSNVLGL